HSLWFYGPPHSVPTRRSSDLGTRDGAAGPPTCCGRGSGDPATAAVLGAAEQVAVVVQGELALERDVGDRADLADAGCLVHGSTSDRKSTRLNSSHVKNSYAVF